MRVSSFTLLCIVLFACSSPSAPPGAAGATGAAGPTGPTGPTGAIGPTGTAGSADTPEQVLAKLSTVDGAGSGLDAATLSGASLTSLALAGTRAIQLSVYGVYIQNNTSIDSGGIELASTGASRFATGFVVPPDYVLLSNMTFRVIAITSGAACTASLAPNALVFRREGHPPDSGPSTNGLTASSGNNFMTMSAPQVPSVKTYTITPHDNFAEILPGDSVTIIMQREADLVPEDDCAQVFITGMSVEYQSR